MKVELTRKDVLNVLRDIEAQAEGQGKHIAAASLEVARAALKRVPELDRIVYLSPANFYVEVTITPEPEEESST